MRESKTTAHEVAIPEAEKLSVTDDATLKEAEQYQAILEGWITDLNEDIQACIDHRTKAEEAIKIVKKKIKTYQDTLPKRPRGRPRKEQASLLDANAIDQSVDDDQLASLLKTEQPTLEDL